MGTVTRRRSVLLILLAAAVAAPGDRDSVLADKEGRNHWAFNPPARPPIPQVKNSDWPRNPIDAFILAKLEARGLAPSPDADQYTLLRRVSLDLTGLLPTPEEIAAFTAENSPDAYEKLIDRLLA